MTSPENDPGVDLRQLARDDPDEAARIRRLAQALLRRGADAHAVHAETYVRLSTLYQWASRQRRQAVTSTARKSQSTACGDGRHAASRAA
ncbi:hypothetical protein [Myxococcus llanfairpwllgwyngyllgogerychwyrndrobwllllantysiliogogogochensis]|uniref:hypothetical protein n=1 Tax=Myxococcus llanfairpwllgwyngyllgogerychwyrndrobwllllantysiliogogogochensis TaxID=2590453 RepID=UPI0015EFED8B|nr:hypothetical protein [Myxococcus llanfairpwllgwyngyllgogerychwyrndrobwllllantysiliogogogochensis]